MKPNTLFALFVSLFIFSIPVSSWSASAENNKSEKQKQAVTLADLKMAVIEATAYATENIHVKHSAHIVTITVLNSKLNDAQRMDREAEAQKIAVAVEKIIVEKPEFSQIAAIHINYVKTTKAKWHLIQGVDFNKSVAGHFQIHKS